MPRHSAMSSLLKLVCIKRFLPIFHIIYILCIKSESSLKQSSSPSTVLSCCLGIVTPFTEGLPIADIPEAGAVLLMRDDMINHCCCGNRTSTVTPHAEGMLCEIRGTRLLPSVVIPPSRGGLALLIRISLRLLMQRAIHIGTLRHSPAAFPLPAARIVPG
jgi:hypothetical protein